MNQSNLIAVDLAKHVFQVCVVDNNSKILLNKVMSRKAFSRWLAKQPTSEFVCEACSSAHYWANKAMSFGHDARLLNAAFVKAFRQGHKTDENDALAIAAAARQPQKNTIQIKSAQQIAMPGSERVREHYICEKTSASNMIRSLLQEFGIVFGKGDKALRENVPLILEDGENEVPDMFRVELFSIYQHWLELYDKVEQAKKRLEERVHNITQCKQLMKLEGIGPVGAVGLYIMLGNGESFKNGRSASACIGVTPTQHSSGGKAVMLGISKRAANKPFRAKLIQGALSAVYAVLKRDPRNQKECWLKDLAQRRGERRAAVALVNKTVRTAWAMLRYGEDYKAHPIITA